MQIIAGAAKNIILEAPPGLEVRPTLARARKALFDSLGAKIPGSTVLDLFAGSGALGLESASRGASNVSFVESEGKHRHYIEKNIEKVRKTGVTAEFKVLGGDATNFAPIALQTELPDLIFADPPYPESAACFNQLLGDMTFLRQCAGALLVWEIPDTPGEVGKFLNHPNLGNVNLRKFGGTVFLTAVIRGGAAL